MRSFGILAALLVLLGAVTPLSPQTASRNSDAIPVECLLSLEEEVEVASQEEGILENLPVEEGAAVSRDQLLAQIDDEIPKMQLRIAENELAVAKEEANNDVKVRYAAASAEVAKADWLKGLEANRRMKGAVSEIEIRKAELTYYQMKLSIEQAQMEQKIAKLQSNVAQAKLDAARENLKRRKIFCPTDGIVVKVKKHVGEWVQKGDTIVRLVRVSLFRAQGDLELAQVAPRDVRGRKVTVKVDLTGGQSMIFPGVLTFIDPQLDTSGRYYMVRAKIENRQENGQWLLQAGMKGEMTIHLK